MDSSNNKTPGVYINEINAFGGSVVPVATAVPAFIGYTPQAMFEGVLCTNVPTKITSFGAFQAIFGLPNPPAPADPVKQYNPQYYLQAETSEPEQGDYLLIGETYYSIVPDPNTVYYLYNSMRLFYENGGGEAYIVSVGSYGPASGVGMAPGTQIVNPNVQLKDLINGLSVLKEAQEPTLYICPEATLLSVENNGKLMQAMLSQCAEMQTSVTILDIIGGRNPDPMMWTEDITVFRNNTGAHGLDYGAAYYPFVGTTIMQKGDIDYTNLFGGDVKQLRSLISPVSAPDTKVETILSHIETPEENPLTVSQYNHALMTASEAYRAIINHILRVVNILPPSGGIAGVIPVNDNQFGPWQPPANIVMIGVVSLPIKISNTDQAVLNVDAVSGKSINAIRDFIGLGVLIWGARTLDGNSLDWKYISTRRTMIFLEQSCKIAIRCYIFQPNDRNTWESIKSIITSFLKDVWKAGGLCGALPTDAFSVECGLGSTMNSEDVLNGVINVTIKVALLHPAEFIVITFQQQQATPS